MRKKPVSPRLSAEAKVSNFTWWTTSAPRRQKCCAIISPLDASTRWIQISVAPASHPYWFFSESKRETREPPINKRALMPSRCPALLSARPDTHHVTYTNGVTRAPAIPFAFSHRAKSQKFDFSLTIAIFPFQFCAQYVLWFLKHILNLTCEWKICSFGEIPVRKWWAKKPPEEQTCLGYHKVLHSTNVAIALGYYTRTKRRLKGRRLSSHRARYMRSDLTIANIKLIIYYPLWQRPRPRHETFGKVFFSKQHLNALAQFIKKTCAYFFPVKRL